MQGTDKGEDSHRSKSTFSSRKSTSRPNSILFSVADLVGKVSSFAVLRHFCWWLLFPGLGAVGTLLPWNGNLQQKCRKTPNEDTFPTKSATLSNIEIDREVDFLDEKVDFHWWGPSPLSLPCIFGGSKPHVVLIFFLWTLRSQNYFHEPYVVQNFTQNNFALDRKNGWKVKSARKWPIFWTSCAQRCPSYQIGQYGTSKSDISPATRSRLVL